MARSSPRRSPLRQDPNLRMLSQPAQDRENSPRNNFPIPGWKLFLRTCRPLDGFGSLGRISLPTNLVVCGGKDRLPNGKSNWESSTRDGSPAILRQQRTVASRSWHASKSPPAWRAATLRAKMKESSPTREVNPEYHQKVNFARRSNRYLIIYQADKLCKEMVKILKNTA